MSRCQCGMTELQYSTDSTTSAAAVGVGSRRYGSTMNAEVLRDSPAGR